jgi:hypothetical protein
MTTQQNNTHLSANAGRSLLILDQLVTSKATGAPEVASPDTIRMMVAAKKHQLEFVAPAEGAPAR